VNLQGVQRANPEFLRRTFGPQAGDVLDARQIAEQVNAVYALSDFERVAYTLSGDLGQPNLNLHVQEKSWGPHIVRFDLGFSISTDANTAFTIGGDYLQTWINDRGGELRGSLRLGRTSGIDTSLYQPLDSAHRWFVEPGLVAQRSVEDLFDDGEAVARYDFTSAWGAIDAGRVFGRRAELRAGIRSGIQSADREIGSPDLPEISREGYGGLAARYTFDSRDRDVLWQRGMVARLAYFRGEEALGAESVYDRFEGTATVVLPFERAVGYLRVSGGSAFDSALPLPDTFSLGGPVSLPGASIGEFRGSSYWSAQASYLQPVADINYIFGQSIYAGLKLTAADMSGRIDGIHAAPIFSGAFVLAGRTPLGPVSLSLAATNTSDWQLMLGLGRPIEERTINDLSW
jgi:NTE family protein